MEKPYNVPEEIDPGTGFSNAKSRASEMTKDPGTPMDKPETISVQSDAKDGEAK
jgi:hypothetical protein